MAISNTQHTINIINQDEKYLLTLWATDNGDASGGSINWLFQPFVMDSPSFSSRFNYQLISVNMWTNDTNNTTCYYSIDYQLFSELHSPIIEYIPQYSLTNISYQSTPIYLGKPDMSSTQYMRFEWPTNTNTKQYRWQMNLLATPKKYIIPTTNIELK